MIFEKSLKENKDFYEILDYYLEMIRDIHKRTKEHLARKKLPSIRWHFAKEVFMVEH